MCVHVCVHVCAYMRRVNNAEDTQVDDFRPLQKATRLSGARPPEHLGVAMPLVVEHVIACSVSAQMDRKDPDG